MSNSSFKPNEIETEAAETECSLFHFYFSFFILFPALQESYAPLSNSPCLGRAARFRHNCDAESAWTMATGRRASKQHLLPVRVVAVDAQPQLMLSVTVRSFYVLVQPVTCELQEEVFLEGGDNWHFSVKRMTLILQP
jgi:hypothetical protein